MSYHSNKNSVIQIMRSLTIILVVLRHVLSQTDNDAFLVGIENIIICFHMPVFFVISGYLFQKKSEKYAEDGAFNFIKKKCIHLLCPYVFWTVILWLGINITCLISSGIKNKLLDVGFETSGVLDLVYGLLTYEKYYTEHLWFLYVLFIFFVISIFTVKIKNSFIFIPVALFWGFITLYISMPHIVERCMIWSVFFVFGRYVATSEKMAELIKCSVRFKMTFIIASLFVGLSVLRLFLLEQSSVLIVNQVVKYVLGFLGTWLIYIISVNISEKERLFNKVIYTIGEYSFDIYLMHNPYFVAISAIALKSVGISSYIIVVLSTVLGLICPIIISKFIIRKIKPLSIVMIGK